MEIKTKEHKCNRRRRKKRKHRQYIHLRLYGPEEILFLVDKKSHMHIINEDITYKVNLSSGRLKTFKRSIKCVECGKIGNVMSLDRFRKKSKIPSAHFNLYYKEDDKYILMTKDHIIPKSKGGKNHISNYQTMCESCNGKKADNLL